MRPAARAALLLLAAAAACAPAYREPEPTGNGPAGGGTVVGTVAPDGTLRADTLPGVVADTASVERTTVSTGAVRAATDGGTPATGWRVQVFAASDRAAAEEFARSLRGRVDDEPVYVEWVDPWYKVRVGDFESRAPADRLRARLEERGIEGAWTVRTTIRTGGGAAGP